MSNVYMCAFVTLWACVGMGMCMYVCIYGSVSELYGCDVGFQKRASQPSRTVFTGAHLEILFWPGHWAFSTWSTSKEEQLDMGRSLIAMSYIKHMK